MIFHLATMRLSNGVSDPYCDSKQGLSVFGLDDLEWIQLNTEWIHLWTPNKVVIVVLRDNTAWLWAHRHKHMAPGKSCILQDCFVRLLTKLGSVLVLNSIKQCKICLDFMVQICEEHIGEHSIVYVVSLSLAKTPHSYTLPKNPCPESLVCLPRIACL